MKDSMTPLKALSCATCSSKHVQLFKNQVIMYQLLIPFISDKLDSYSSSYAPTTVDNLIIDVRRFLYHKYTHPNQITDEDASFTQMHNYIRNNLAISSIDSIHSDSNNGSNFSPFDFTILASNISKSINNARPLPTRLTHLLISENSSYSLLLFRCFWMLQYYFVYYRENLCHASKAVPTSHLGSECIEYFQINENISPAIYDELKHYCSKYSSVYSSHNLNTIDFYSLSRIILDVIVSQVNLRRRINIDQLINSLSLRGFTNSRVTEMEQYIEFQKYINGFGTHSFDRYTIVQKFASTNCYAADELADIYYWGKSFWIRDNNYFDVQQDYDKAAKWWLRSIELSNPPLQSACWSLGYTLLNMHYETDIERVEAESKALEYLKLAGEYPAAKNSIAHLLFSEAERLLASWTGDRTTYDVILDKLLTAIRLADQAGSMHWFYGNNQIANFLLKHSVEENLLGDLQSRLKSNANSKLHVPLDVEAQLKFSVSYHNPWALKHLALYYFEHGRNTEAEALLEEAISINYNAAYYVWAVHLLQTNSPKWYEYMHKASSLSFAEATYVLAKGEENPEERLRLINLCKEQIYSDKELDIELLGKLESLMSQ